MDRSELSAEEVTRYETQLTKVRAILEAFDRPDTDFAAVVGLLQEMQACGLPPEEIMRELSGGGGGPDGIPGLGGAMPGAEGMPPGCTLM